MRYLFLLLLMLPSALNAQVNMANLTGTTGNVQTNIDARLPISGGIGTNETFLGTTMISDLVVTNGTGPWVKLTGDTMNGPLGITGGTVTVSTPVLNLSQTWNDGAVLFVGKENNFTNTASLATSRMEDWKKDGINKFSLSKDGYPYVWGSYTDINNYRRLRISQTSGGAATIAAEGLGTGLTGNSLTLGANGSDIATLDVGGLSLLLGYIQMTQSAPPSPPGSNKARIYIDKPGSKMRLMVIFNTGAAQQIAIEP